MRNSDYRCIEVRREDDILHVVIDHPDSAMNVIDDDLHGDLARLFHDLKRESEVRAVLLSGRGKVFSAGGSFDWFKTLSTPRRVFDLHRDARQLIWDLLDVEIPIVAAVHGHAVGLAASISLFCDVIFMAESAKISDPHVRAGLVAGDGGVVAWPLAVGPARAKEFLMTGDPVTAKDAERFGLVNHVVPDDQLAETALAFARRVAAGAPMAVRYTKMAVNKLVKDALNVAFDASIGFELTTMLSEDHKEAIAAFDSKRAPKFTGN